MVEVYTGNIFQGILSEERSLADEYCKEFSFPGEASISRSSVAHQEELKLSIIGSLLWSDSFVDNDDVTLSSNDGDDKEDGGTDRVIDLPDHSESKQEPQSSVSTLAASISAAGATAGASTGHDSSQKRKRRVAPLRMTASQVCYELSKPNISPHLLIVPHVYGESFGAGQGASQPFEVKVHPQVTSSHKKAI